MTLKKKKRIIVNRIYLIMITKEMISITCLMNAQTHILVPYISRQDHTLQSTYNLCIREKCFVFPLDIHFLDSGVNACFSGASSQLINAI